MNAITAADVTPGSVIMSELEPREVLDIEQVGSRIWITIRLSGDRGTLTFSERPDATVVRVS